MIKPAPQDVSVSFTKTVSTKTTDTTRELQICLMCPLNNPSKYCCPKCFVVSCSLECCLRHKLEMNCNGKRDITAYKPLCHMSDSDVKSDFHFLEQVLNCQHVSQRVMKEITPTRPTIKVVQDDEVHPLLQKSSQRPLVEEISTGSNTNTGQKRKRTARPSASNRFKVQTAAGAHDRDTTVLLMPVGMSRSKSNTSQYHTHHDALSWRLEWVLHSATGNAAGGDDAPTRVYDRSVSESAVISTAFSKHKHVLTSTNKPTNVIFLMAKIPAISSKPIYYRIDGTTTLRDALKGKTVLEYPTIVVVDADEDDSWKLTFPLFIDDGNHNAAINVAKTNPSEATKLQPIEQNHHPLPVLKLPPAGPNADDAEIQIE